jgi:hypothetical protein
MVIMRGDVVPAIRKWSKKPNQLANQMFFLGDPREQGQDIGDFVDLEITEIKGPSMAPHKKGGGD